MPSPETLLVRLKTVGWKRVIRSSAFGSFLAFLACSILLWQVWYLKDIVPPPNAVGNDMPQPLPKVTTETSNHLVRDLLGASSNFNATIDRMWTCPMLSSVPYTPTLAGRTQVVSRKKKLIFVHVFKTAGSTMRVLLGQYGAFCGKGVAIVSACSGLSTASVATQDRQWSNRKNQPCRLQWACDRSGKSHSINQGLSNAFLRDRGVDILAGHLPIGAHQYWMDASEPNQTVDAQYLTFFREPLYKFVSGKLYTHRHKKWNATDVLALTRKQILQDRSQGLFYEKYTTYLLTPQQKEEKLSIDEKVRTAALNLIEMNVIVGIVEHMEQSLELLYFVIDGTADFQRFQYADGTTGQTNKSTGIVVNKSELSTDEIVAEIYKDKDLHRAARDYLRYEYQLYELALQLHTLQRDWLIRSKASAP